MLPPQIPLLADPPGTSSKQYHPSTPTRPTSFGRASLGGGTPSRYQESRGHSRSPYQPPRPQQSLQIVPLPIPRNHVLMCLIEAVHAESREDDGYQSGDDDELVLRGIKVMGSSSGTYIVREPAGLKVYRSNSPIYPSGPEENSVLTLHHGQTVQIFLFENRIATVARGGGYILVDNSSQLVKIAEVTDPACKYEATNKVLLVQIEELEAKVLKLRKHQLDVERKLEDTLAESANSSPFGPVPEVLPVYDLEEEDGRGDDRRDDSGGSLARKTTYADPNDSTLIESHSFDHPRSALHSKIGCTSSFGEESTREPKKKDPIPRRRDRSKSQDQDAWSSFWPSIFGSSGSPSSIRPRMEPRTGDPPMGIGQMITNHVAPASPGRNHSRVDFSGLSGHSGLSRSSKSKNQGRRNVRMLSHHSGARFY
ncbi:MAG: hypothetical protein SGBAC_000042 [Bacillariaceae sp.]